MTNYDKLVAALRSASTVSTAWEKLMMDAADAIEALQAQMPKRGKWLKTDAFPHRVYCSCCYKTYVPNANWQIWQDDADNFGLPRNYCPNCGAKMEVQDDRK